MSDKRDMAVMEEFKLKLKKTETQKKNPLPSQETIEQKKQAGVRRPAPLVCTVHSTNSVFLFYFF
ncbi:thymosin beta-4-like [Phyllostomus discolor]|uniref:Thymosin beta-4-like n=1 Tax=Phyllostomus discolor TaxID=89673 RepID=A0A7E6DMF2_9CHIR|nr:thymosin beta-4-like [Phyllostomus discolor]